MGVDKIQAYLSLPLFQVDLVELLFIFKKINKKKHFFSSKQEKNNNDRKYIYIIKTIGDINLRAGFADIEGGNTPPLAAGGGGPNLS